MDAPRRVTVEIEPGSDPIRGRVEDAWGDQRPFTGWLQLARALEAASEPPAEPSGREGLRE